VTFTLKDVKDIMNIKVLYSLIRSVKPDEIHNFLQFIITDRYSRH